MGIELTVDERTGHERRRTTTRWEDNTGGSCRRCDPSDFITKGEL